MPNRLAVFISPHGFGHAARACALIEALDEICAAPIELSVFTSVPEWFLRESLTRGFERIEEVVDVGLVQRGPLHEDMQATARAVAELLDPDRALVARFATALAMRGCEGVVADIAPLGLAAAAAAGLPSALVENFTWDWIYAGHPDAPPRLREYGGQFAGMNAGATLHVQTVPVCAPDSRALQVGPIARRPRLGREATRRCLGVGEGEKLALVSLGGIPTSMQLPRSLPPGWRVVVLGNAVGELVPGVEVLPHHSNHYHPDLACAADVIVGKLGYSTVAEAWQGGCGLVWARRPAFAETAVLAEHVRRVMPNAALDVEEVIGGAWVEVLESLTPATLPTPFRDGAGEAASAIVGMLGWPTR